MKKLLLTFLFFLTSVLSYAWMQCQYTVSYDNNFAPEVSLELSNNTNKTVSNIDFIIFLKRKGAGMWDITAVKEIHINQPTNMQPSTKQNFRLKPNVPDGWEINKVGVEKIRFLDGTIKQY